MELKNPTNPTMPGLVSPWDVLGDNIRIKLFDYTGKVNSGGEKEINQVWGDAVGASTWRAGSGVNNGRTFLFTGGGRTSDSTDYYNYYTGQNPAVMQGIVTNHLRDGYPVLTGVYQSGADDSLGYLFGAGGQNGVTEYTGTDGKGLKGLLRKDEKGYYYYSSEQNYASLNDDKDEILIYSESYDKDSPSVNSRKIGLFPFDPYRAGQDKAGEEKGPYGSPYNHQFGMTMEADFYLPPNGILPNGEDMVFNFSGDDDVWVYIDDVLVLDLGGVHQPLSGTIDFANNEGSGKTKVIDASIQSVPGQTTVGTGKTLTELFEAAGETYDNSPYSLHKIKFFYMERGGCDSNCTLSFNLLTYLTAEAQFHKADDQNTPLANAVFGLYTDQSCRNELKVSNKQLTATSNENGVVSFPEIPPRVDENGKEFVTYYMKELQAPVGFHSNDTVYKLVYNQTQNKYEAKNLDDTDAGTVFNTPLQPIKLTVDKVWAGGVPTNNPSASFELKRFKSYDGVISNEPCTLNVYRYKSNNNPVKVGTKTYKVGTEATIGWKYSYNYLLYTGGPNIPNEYRDYSYDMNGNWQDGSGSYNDYSLTIPITQPGEINIYLRDENMGTQWGSGVTNVNVTPDSNYSASAEPQHVSATNEPDTSYHGPTITLPYENKWTYEFPEQPAYSERTDGIVEYYSYYIEETKHEPGVYHVAYDSTFVNEKDNKTYPTGSSTSETRTVTNFKNEVHVAKRWYDAGGNLLDPQPDISVSATLRAANTEGKVTDSKPTKGITAAQPGTWQVQNHEGGLYNAEEKDPPAGYTVTYTYQEAGEASDHEGTSVHRGGTIYINNTQNGYPLTIKKVIQGTDIGLVDATFTLTKVDGDGHEIEGTEAYTASKDSVSGGLISFEGLKPGDYMLDETGMPEGYVKTEGPYYINISNTGTITLKNSETYSLIKPGSDGVAFRLENTPGVALPSAGGTGTGAFAVLGTILAAGAGVMLIRKKRAT